MSATVEDLEKRVVELETALHRLATEIMDILNEMDAQQKLSARCSKQTFSLLIGAKNLNEN